jgi:hypothetical protein
MVVADPTVTGGGHCHGHLRRGPDASFAGGRELNVGMEKLQRLRVLGKAPTSPRGFSFCDAPHFAAARTDVNC